MLTSQNGKDDDLKANIERRFADNENFAEIQLLISDLVNRNSKVIKTINQRKKMAKRSEFTEKFI